MENSGERPTVLVLNMSPDDLVRLYAEQNEKHAEQIAQQIASVEDIRVMISDHIVDRLYLERNFGWKRRKIEALERDGILRPESGVEANNGKTKFYKLGKCIELYKTMTDGTKVHRQR